MQPYLDLSSSGIEPAWRGDIKCVATTKQRAMSCMSRIAVCACTALSLASAADVSSAASSRGTITCPYLQAEDLKFEIPPNIGDLPPIEFDYPSKVTLFSFRDGHLLLVAMDEDEPSRLRIVISAQHNKARGTYDGQIVVDMGGNEIQLHSGPVRCRVNR
jgi:hypothetical protein